MKRLIAPYLVSVMVSLGAFNANMRSHDWSCETKSVRERYAEALAFALVPAANVPAAILATGFLEHGWTLHPGTCEWRYTDGKIGKVQGWGGIE